MAGFNTNLMWDATKPRRAYLETYTDADFEPLSNLTKLDPRESHDPMRYAVYQGTDKESTYTPEDYWNMTKLLKGE